MTGFAAIDRPRAAAFLLLTCVGPATARMVSLAIARIRRAAREGSNMAASTTSSIGGEGRSTSSIARDRPAIRRIQVADLLQALRSGWDDFRAAPTQLIFLCVIYPVVGLIAAKAAFGYQVLPLLFPLASGFALIGPLAAIGVYELSRRRERGMDPSWLDAFAVLRSPQAVSIAGVALLMLGIFAVWMFAAAAIYSATVGRELAAGPETMGGFLHAVFQTRAGWALIALGNLAGLVFAGVVLTLTVVSLPMLIDRDAGVAVAIGTSVRAVRENPRVMAVWGLIVAASLLAGSALCFAGLAVALPVLGHATWHLYRRVVV